MPHDSALLTNRIDHLLQHLDQQLGRQEGSHLGKHKQVTKKEGLCRRKNRSDCHCWSLLGYLLRTRGPQVHRRPSADQQALAPFQRDKTSAGLGIAALQRGSLPRGQQVNPASRCSAGQRQQRGRTIVPLLKNGRGVTSKTQ